MDVLDNHFIDFSTIDTVEKFEELEYSHKILLIYRNFKYIGKDEKQLIYNILEDINCEQALPEIFHSILVTIQNSELL